MLQLPSLTNPTLISVFYRAGSDYHASLSIKGSNEPTSTMTVIYDSLMNGVQTFTVAGDRATVTWTVQDCELFSVIVRRESVVVGVGVFQVDVQLVGTHGLVLAPMSLLNMDVDQVDLDVIRRAAPDNGDQTYSKLVEGSQVL